jgi:OOP family OmpA-OmpF porin
MNQIAKLSRNVAISLGAMSLMITAGCSTKNYVKSQTAPLVQKTNELDDAAAANNRAIQATNDKAQAGIQQAQQSANTATQNAAAANQASAQAQSSAQEAVNRADSLASVVANLDNYKQIGDVSVTFGFNKSNLTKDDMAQLDTLGGTLTAARGYILEVTGGTDSVGSADYNYQLSQRRAESVVQYLASKFKIPAHKFYLIGIGKDVEVATNKTAAGRAQNRRVEVQVLSNQGGANGTAVSQVR